MKKKDQTLEVELETKSSHFIKHDHNPEKTDLVICIEEDKELPVETYLLNSFKLKRNKTTKISAQVSLKTRNKIEKHADKKEISTSELLRRSINQYIKDKDECQKVDEKILNKLMTKVESKDQKLTNIRRKLLNEYNEGAIELNEESLEMIL